MTEPKDSKKRNAEPFSSAEALRGRSATYDMLANVHFVPLTAEQADGFSDAPLHERAAMPRHTNRCTRAGKGLES